MKHRIVAITPSSTHKIRVEFESRAPIYPRRMGQIDIVLDTRFGDSSQFEIRRIPLFCGAAWIELTSKNMTVFRCYHGGKIKSLVVDKGIPGQMCTLKTDGRFDRYYIGTNQGLLRIDVGADGKLVSDRVLIGRTVYPLITSMFVENGSLVVIDRDGNQNKIPF